MNSTDFIKSIEKSSCILFSELLKTNCNKNIIFSPFSIQSCLYMTRMGAEGQTAIEIEKGLGSISPCEDEFHIADYYHEILEDLFERNHIVTIANKIYVNKDYKIQHNFKKILTNYFFSSIESIDFGDKNKAAETINTWMENETKKLIKNIVSPSNFVENPPYKTSLVLLNAIYFKGDWETRFDLICTKETDFYLDETKKVKIQMMGNLSKFRFGEFPELDATGLEMPYRDCDISMLIILPNTRTGLAKLEKQLETVSIESLKQQMHLTDVSINIPKFKAEFEVDLKDILQNFGIKRMFTTNAEFGKMLKIKSGEWLEVSDVIHKACIEVNENGTVAAAATRFLLRGGGYPSKKISTFNANRPFYYRIQTSKGIALFKGHVCSF